MFKERADDGDNMISNWLNPERLIHSIKTVIACGIGIAFARLIGFPADQWIIITIIVVMCAQIYVGSVIQKAYWRFLGTLVGCLFATTALITMGNSDISVLAAIGLSSFIFSYVATQQENLTYAATLGAVTTAVIMLGHEPTTTFAAERFLEISIGLFIATFVSQFILPIRASTHLRRAQAATLRQLRDYYQAALAQPNDNDTIDYHELDEQIAKSIIKQRQLAKESTSEKQLGSSFDIEHFTKSLYCERECLRAITFMHNALTHVKSASTLFAQSREAQSFNNDVATAFETIANVIAANKPTQQPLLIPSINGFRLEIQKDINFIHPDDILYLDGFLFTAEVLANNLAALAFLYHIPISATDEITKPITPPAE